MKVILEYNLPEERNLCEDAANGTKWKTAFWHFDQYLRTKTKYAPDSMPENVYKELSETRDELHRILNENELTLK